MPMTRDWDSSYEATPASTEQISNGDDRIRNLKTDTRERGNSDHFWGNATATTPDSGDITNNDSGYHRQVTLKDGGSSGTPPSNHVQIHYTSGVAYLKDSAGSDQAIAGNFIDLPSTDVSSNPNSGSERIFQTSGIAYFRNSSGTNDLIQTEVYAADFSDKNVEVESNTSGNTLSLSCDQLFMKSSSNKNTGILFTDVDINAQSYSTYKDGWSTNLTSGTVMYLYLEGDSSTSTTTGQIYVSTESDEESYSVHSTNDYYRLVGFVSPNSNSTYRPFSMYGNQYRYYDTTKADAPNNGIEIFNTTTIDSDVTQSISSYCPALKYVSNVGGYGLCQSTTSNRYSMFIRHKTGFETMVTFGFADSTDDNESGSQAEIDIFPSKGDFNLVMYVSAGSSLTSKFYLQKILLNIMR